MINNVGSVTEEGPHLSDCEEASLVDNEDQTNTPTESCSGVPEPTNSYLSDSVPPEKNVVEDGGDDITVIKATVSSIYIDDGVLNMEKPMSTVEQKPTRMTMVSIREVAIIPLTVLPSLSTPRFISRLPHFCFRIAHQTYSVVYTLNEPYDPPCSTRYNLRVPKIQLPIGEYLQMVLH